MYKVGIIGNAVLYSIVCAQLYCASGTIDISIHDMNGRKTTQVVVGQPFQVYVTMHEIDANKAHVTIQRPSDVGMQRTSVQMRSINGKSTTTYVYASRIDNKGKHTIGPVIVDDGTHRYTSGMISLDVVHMQQQQVASARAEDEGILRLYITKTNAYVGETIPCKIRFLYAHDDSKPERLIQPSIAHAKLSTFEGPFIGTETIDTTIYNYVEWRWDVTFERPGTHIIPAYAMEYSTCSTKLNHFGMFSAFFNDLKNIHQVYSNALECVIAAVPSNAQASGFVGHIITAQASLDVNRTTVDKAVVLTIELVGEHHNAAIQPLLLQNLPKSLKYYESKTETISCDNTTVTRFEYVLQPREEGEWEIPSQSFTYFDTHSDAYISIDTNPLSLMAGAGQVVHSSSENCASLPIKEISRDDVCDGLRPLHEQGPWIKEPDAFIIPWYIFWHLLLIPVWYFVWIVLSTLYAWYLVRTAHKRRVRSAHRCACTAIKLARTHCSVNELPMIFKKFFADTLNISVHDVTQGYMHEIFKQKKLSPDIQQEWDIFWNRLIAYAFTPIMMSTTEKKLLYEESIQWLGKLDIFL